MTQSNVKFIQNYFFEIFVLEYPQFGSLALGYFSPFKEILNLPKSQQQEVLGWLGDLFKSNCMVGGDLNSSPGAVAKILGELNLEGRWSEVPTYLFSAPSLSEKAIIPCFDNFLIFNPAISDYSLEALIKLPETTSKNPRGLMKELNSPSDHVPVISHLSKENDKLNVGFYNVADPLLWGKIYPTAADGFEMTARGESKRLQSLQYYIKILFKKTDLFALVEVPISLKEWLREQAKIHSKTIIFRKMVETEKDIEGYEKISPIQPSEASLLVLLY